MLLDDLYEIVEPITADLGYILWGIEVVGSGKLTIRILLIMRMVFQLMIAK